MNVKLTKDLVVTLASIGISVGSIFIDQHKQTKQSEQIADLVIEKMIEKGIVNNNINS